MFVFGLGRIGVRVQGLGFIGFRLRVCGFRVESLELGCSPLILTVLNGDDHRGYYQSY